MQFEFRLSSLCLAGAFGRIAPMQKSVGLCDRDRGSSWFASSEASTHSRAERAKHANSTRESHSLSSMMSSDSKGSRPRMTEIDSITVRTSMEYKPMAIRVPLIFARRVVSVFAEYASYLSHSTTSTIAAQRWLNHV